MIPVWFAIQEAIARNDRRALAQLAPCACHEDAYDISDDGFDTCPAKVWNGCRALEYEEWDSRGSNWEYDLQEFYDSTYDPDDDIPDAVALMDLAAEISQTAPTGWCATVEQTCFESEGLLLAHAASDHVLFLAVKTNDLHVTVHERDRSCTYEALDPIKLPPRTYFTSAWILHVLTRLFIKYHP